MDSVRRLFSNFQKHSTITWLLDKKGVETEENDLIKAKGIPIDNIAGHLQALSDPIKSIDDSKNTFDGMTNLTNDDSKNTFDGMTNLTNDDSKNTFDGVTNLTNDDSKNTFDGMTNLTNDDSKNTFDGQTNLTNDDIKNTFDGQTNLTNDDSKNTFDGMTNLTNDDIKNTFDGQTNLTNDDSKNTFDGMTNLTNDDSKNTFDCMTNLTNTSACLEEFDEILKDINKDINTEAITLDDVDDVLTSFNEVTLNLDTPRAPRFDLQDLVQNFGLNFEEIDIKPTNIDDCMEPYNLYEDIEYLDESFVDKLEVISKNVTSKEDCMDDVISISSEDSQVEPKTEHKEKKGIQEIKNMRLDEETSVKNDKITDKQNVSVETKPNDSDILLINDPESKRYDFENVSLTNEPKIIAENDLDFKSQDVISIIDSDFEPYDEFNSQDDLKTISQVNESETITKNDLDFKSQDIISIIDSDFEPNDIDFKSQDKIQIVSQVNESKTIAENDMDMKSHNEFGPNNIEFKKREKFENENDKYHKIVMQDPNAKSGYDSDDCGYQSSDFEFITEEEAKLDGLIINYNPKVNDRIIKPKRVKTIEISIDTFSKCISSENISPATSLENSDSNSIINNGSFELQLSGTHVTQNSVDTNEHSNDKKNSSLQSLINFRRCKNTQTLNDINLTQDLQNCIDSYDSGQKNLERVDLRFHFSHSNRQRQENDDLSYYHGLSDFTENRAGLSTYEENCPRLNDSRENCHNDLGWNNPEPNMDFNLPGSRTIGGNCRFDDDIQRWRAFQQNRNQFIFDQSYRENHVVLTDEDYYQLFNPDHMPRNQSIRTENKSTLTSTMLIDYGIGYDMQMARNIESEDEDTKEEALVSAKRILDMYPGENRKKRRYY